MNGQRSGVLVDNQKCLVGGALRTPRAAAIAGIVFSILLMVSLWLLRESTPTGPSNVGEWLRTSSEKVSIALNLVPFAGVAFMWFLGVMRDRLGAQEDKFFATVFLGSGLMFLGMIFVAAAGAAALVAAYASLPKSPLDTSPLVFPRTFIYDVMHIYAFKMAAVFMMTTSTLAIRTCVTARWIALLGFAAAMFLLVGSGYLDWALFVFPSWVLLVSLYILIDNLQKHQTMVADQ